MTDADLLQLLQDKLPEELTPDELALISSWLRESPELRQALHEQVQMDERLAATLGRVEVSVDAILARRGRLSTASAGIPNWLGWTATIALLAAACYLTFDLLTPAPVRPDVKVAEGTKPGTEQKPPASDNDPDKAPDTTDAAPSENPLTARATVQPPAKSLVIGADKFINGDLKAVQDDEPAVDGQGKVGAVAEYEVEVPDAGDYRLHTRYAPGFARPVRLSVNGTEILPLALGESSNVAKRDAFQWFNEGLIPLQKGRNVLRLQALSYFPALSRLSLMSVKDEIPKEPLQLTLDATKYIDEKNITVDEGGIIGARTPKTPVTVEYQIDSPVTARFLLSVQYAAGERRAIRIACNKTPVISGFTLINTGGWGTDKKTWREITTVSLTKGRNTLTIQSDQLQFPGKDVTAQSLLLQPFPHVFRWQLREIIGDNLAKRPPWDSKEQYLAAPRPWSEIAVDGFPRTVQPPTSEEVSRWLVQNRWWEENWDRYRVTKVNGLLPLHAPWAEDTVLRMALINPNKFQLHFWRGLNGVTVRAYDWPRKTWIAYATERDSLNDQKPKRFVQLLGSDEDRLQRTTSTQYLGPISWDIACQGGRLTFRRADIETLAVPFAGLPEETYLEGESSLRGLQLVRRNDQPPTPPEVKPTWQIDRFDKQEWTKKLPANATLTFAADGAAELSGDKLTEPAWAAFKLPSLKFGEYVFQVTDATPGSRIYLGKSNGEPRALAAVIRDTKTRSTMVEALHPWDQRREGASDVDNMLTGWIAPPLWIRVNYWTGAARVWISRDGVQWARLRAPLEGLSGSVETLGLQLAPAEPTCRIQLKQVQFREFSAVAALCPADVLASAPAIAGGWPIDFQKEVAQKRPGQIDAVHWETACLLKMLLTVPAKDPSNNMWLRLAELHVTRQANTAARLQLLDELVQLADLSDERVMKVFFGPGGFYEQTARLASEAGELRPFTAVSTSVYRAPFVCNAPNFWQFYEDPLAKQELYNLIYGERWNEAGETARRLRMYAPSNPNDTFLDWAEDAIGQRLGRYEFAAKIRPDRQAPLVEELSKEAYNIAAEFASALQAEAYKDAVQIVSGALVADKQLGMLPAASDKRLLLSLRANVAMALQEYPELRKAMADQFGQVGQLRLRQAMATGEAGLVEGLATQFPNTEVAVEALRWLGDRELSAGNLAAAAARYRAAYVAANPVAGKQIAARQRLVEALNGRDFGKPVDYPVEIGETKLEAAEFERTVQQLRSSRASQPGAVLDDPYQSASRQTPNLNSLNGTKHITWDTKSFPTLKTVPQQWRDWYVEGVAAGSALVYSNRLQVVAWDTRANRLLWISSLGADAGSVIPVMNTPFRPLVTEGLVLARVMGQLGPRLHAIETGSGNLRWEYPSRDAYQPGILVSDPVAIKDEVCVLGAVQKGDEWRLELRKLERRTGAVRANNNVPMVLARLRTNWNAQRGGALTLADGHLIAVAGGAVICCDYDGSVRWVRKQEWISAVDDRGSDRQVVQPALFANGVLYVQQPGVKAIEAIELESGLLRWRNVIPAVVRIIGRVDKTLVVQTQTGLKGINLDDGVTRWTTELTNVQQAFLCGGAGGVAVIAANPGTTTPTDFRWIQLDGPTGRIVKTLDHPDFHTTPNLAFGPMFQATGSVWLWFGSSDGDNRPALWQFKE